MGHRCCNKQKVKRGLWSPEEDEQLVKYINTYGHGSWSSVPKLAGLQRCGKSCRLRWINYLRPDLKRGSFSSQEEQIIIDVHRILGNRWAQIAKHLPGRTDNEVKNFWNSCIKKKLMSQGLDPKTHNLIPSHKRTNININKKIVSKIPQSHQQPFSIITVSSQMTDTSIDIINAPILTMPSPSQQTSSVPIINDQETNNIISSDTVNDSIIFTSTDEFGTLDENCIWGSNYCNNNVEPIQAPGMETLQVQGQGKVGESHYNGVLEMDAIDGSTFGLEFVDSTLLATSAFCNQLNIIDDLTWNF